MQDQAPRPEYPRPTLVRPNWLNLNGTWMFEADPDDLGRAQHWQHRTTLENTINVPFPIESEASGIHNLNPARVNWYQRNFKLPGEWHERVILNIGAVDHWAEIWVNDNLVTHHRGGYTPISVDITDALVTGENLLTLRVEDGPSWTQPRGKQAGTTRWPIDYETVTGIWQTVWLEPAPETRITAIHSEFSSTGQLTLYVETNRQNKLNAKANVFAGEENIAQGNRSFDSRSEAKVTLDLNAPRLWSPKDPFLHDLLITLFDDEGNEVDAVQSYVGLRTIGHDGKRITINGEPTYLRGVLDQGYFPGGWYTPLSDDDIRRDVQLTLDLGFNCARKHQKIEDPRYLYWADRLGLLVWEEMPSGRIFSSELVTSLTTEWQEVLRRDRQHPCIIAWVPFNESWGIWNQADRPEQRAFQDSVVHLTKALDQSRLVVGNDGWEFSSGDLWTLHVYEADDSDASMVGKRIDKLIESPHSPVVESENGMGQRLGALPGADVSKLPVLLTECGGVGYSPGQLEGGEFSYGTWPRDEIELLERIQAVAQALGNASSLAGFVWTQLTDVEQEINGLLYFDRQPKLPLDQIREIIQKVGE